MNFDIAQILKYQPKILMIILQDLAIFIWICTVYRSSEYTLGMHDIVQQILGLSETDSNFKAT